MGVLGVCLVLALTGCARTAEVPEVVVAPAWPLETPVHPPVPVPMGPEARTLRLRRSVTLHAGPDPSEGHLGTIAANVRVRPLSAVLGAGCKTMWVELAPRGWVCGTALAEDRREPWTPELPRVGDDHMPPGTYLKVVGRRARRYRTLSDAIRGRRGRRIRTAVVSRSRYRVERRGRGYVRLEDRSWVREANVRTYTPSDFEGLALAPDDGLALPVVWIRRGKPVPVLDSPEDDATVRSAVWSHSVHRLHEQSADHRWVRIGPDAWVPRDRVRIAARTRVPEDVTFDERWIDVDLEEQTLVAWRGDQPLFATLISSGVPGFDTPVGEHRIWIKFAETEMRGARGDHRYVVHAIPWVAYFSGNVGFHAAYWHERFGETASSGCVNLAPQDARFVYHFAGPDTPGGWTMAYDHETLPGTRVRVHQGPLPEPGPAPVCSPLVGQRITGVLKG